MANQLFYFSQLNPLENVPVKNIHRAFSNGENIFVEYFDAAVGKTQKKAPDNKYIRQQISEMQIVFDDHKNEPADPNQPTLF